MPTDQEMIAIVKIVYYTQISRGRDTPGHMRGAHGRSTGIGQEVKGGWAGNVGTSLYCDFCGKDG